MRLKFNEILIGAFLLVLGLSFYGCVEEDTIEPIKRPFSEIRVVNLSNNVDNMRVLIDNQQVGILPITGATGYLELKSGDRNFVVFNQSGDKVFEKKLTAASYERTTIIFTGFYSTDIDLNTFQNFEIEEGEVLVNSAPAAQRLNVYVVNAAATLDTSLARSYQLRANIGGGPTDTTYRNVAGVNENPIPFGKSYSIGNTIPGEYIFRLTANGVTANTTPMNLASGLRYYLFIYGSPNNIQFSLNEVVPQPTRSK